MKRSKKYAKAMRRMRRTVSYGPRPGTDEYDQRFMGYMRKLKRYTLSMDVATGRDASCVRCVEFH